MANNEPNKTMMDSGFSNWAAKQLPDLTGKVYVITGGNSGLGLEAAKHLGKAGADVVLACRSVVKADDAAKELRTHIKGSVDVVQLDLGDLSSVRSAAAEIREKHSKIDALINNAGIMQTPEQKTADGFEMQFGTNHLGHFLLSGLLIDLVEAAAGRVVTLSSIAHFPGVISFDDLMGAKKYSSMGAYSQSKGANLLFAFELDRRLQAAGKKAISIACHPGYSNTNLQSTGPTGFFNFLYKITNPLLAQSPSEGALPTVLAAGGTEAKRGGYYGPQKMGETRGPVSDAKVAPYVLDERTAKRLWDESEKLVGYQWT
ncbi:MAG: NAD(P)-dependent dehydrogenase (short-subunit alcohol dehydrogenase family) [Candidatus Azotimanducaceae bacterium]|jgi:NAD(P)-dependent dehydrogenase (short-subunit alcohol dehydrogenase family)